VCPCSDPSPEPDSCQTHVRRVLSRVGRADHVVTPQAPWTGSGWRGYSRGGFGGGHSPFHTQSPKLLSRSSMCALLGPFRSVRDLARRPARCLWQSGIPEPRSSRWLRRWLPGRHVHGSGGHLCNPANYTICLHRPDWSSSGLPGSFRVYSGSSGLSTVRTWYDSPQFIQDFG
jgi:hypothetical protein